MSIFLNILFFAIGLVFLIKGADFFVTGSSAIAKKLRVPSLIIGLTIVAVGTSLPELAVSLTSAIKGSMDISVGNVVGSSMFNMMFILGFVAIFFPLTMQKGLKKFDLPFMLLVTGMLLLFSADTIFDGATANTITRIESIILLALLVYYYFILIRDGIKASKQEAEELTKKMQDPNFEQQSTQPQKNIKVWQMIVYTLVGLGAVVFGGECVSSTSQFLAKQIGMSEALVGLTIVAMGTSLPEFATSLMAAKKGERDIAIGNVVGSNIANIVLILGTVGTIGGIPVKTDMLIDILILFVYALVFCIICWKKGQLKRLEGIILVSMFFAYMGFAIVRNYCF